MDKLDRTNTNPPDETKTGTPVPFDEKDEIDYERMKVEKTIVIGGEESNNEKIEALKTEGLEIQNRFKDWILKAVFDYYDIKIPNLVFDSRSPWLAPEKDIIFFRVIDVRSGANFLVAADLDKQKNITDYRVKIEK